MSRTVIAAVDGTAESLAGAEWAADEAGRRGLPLHILHVWQDWSTPYAHAPLTGAATSPGAATVTQHWAERIPREASELLQKRHPGLAISVEQVLGNPVDVLLSAAEKAEILVLGSRGLSTLSGFLAGSVSLPVIARATRPVVVVRAGERLEEELLPRPAAGTPAAGRYREVVLGLGLTRPCEEVIEYAFEAAASRAAALRVVHGWNLPPVFGYDPAAVDPKHGAELGLIEEGALADALRPWKDTFPNVGVTEQSVVGRLADHLVEASKGASLLVVGRRIRRTPTAIRTGPVTHAVLHHATCPVAVVPHH